MKVLGLALIVSACSLSAFGAIYAPEIDSGSAGSALALLTGALLVIRSRKK